MDFWSSGLLTLWISGLPDFWPYGFLVFLTSGLMDFWSSGLLTFLASGLPDFWPSFLMSQKCPDFDILDLLCLLHQSQIPNVLPDTIQCLNMSISMKRGVNHFLRLLDSSRTFRDGGPYLKYLNREDAAHLMSLTFSWKKPTSCLKSDRVFCHFCW